MSEQKALEKLDITGRAIDQAKAEGRAEAFRECADALESDAEAYGLALLVARDRTNRSAIEARMDALTLRAKWCEAQAKAQEPPK